MDEEMEREMPPPTGPLAARLKGQNAARLDGQSNQAFYRNLEEAIDVRRETQMVYSLVDVDHQRRNTVDFSSNDLLSLGSNGIMAAEYLAELSRHPGFPTTSGGSRIVDGSYAYLEAAEKEIAAFHGYEAGLIFNSGYDANVGIWTGIPRPGDVILYDEASHMSTIDGISGSLAAHRVEFRHNDIESFREALELILSSNPLVKRGKRCVLVAVEAIYSMDGDVCPLQEMVDIARDLSQQQGNVQFVVDEAYSTGVVGRDGKGFVCELGLEKDIAIILHSFAKGMASHGAIVVGKQIVRSALVNFAKSFQFTSAPPFPLVAAMKSGYNLVTSAASRKARENIQQLAGLFFQEMTSHALWEVAEEAGLLSIPLSKGWEERQFLGPVITVWTRQKCTFWLYFHLVYSGFSVLPVEHPVVPTGQSRLKVTVHGDNTREHVCGLVKAIYEWVEEMLNIEDTGQDGTISSTASKVYDWMKKENLTGWGLT